MYRTNRKVRESIKTAQDAGVRIILGRPESPPPSLGWAPHLAETVDIIPQTPSEEGATILPFPSKKKGS